MEGTNGSKVHREPNRRSGHGGSYRPYSGTTKAPPTWGEIPEVELQHFIGRLVDGGGCCIFSRSSDGGVLSLTAIYGNERFRAFPRSAEEAVLAFRDILATLMLET